MSCPRCQASNPDDAQSCGRCGLSLASIAVAETLAAELDATAPAVSPVYREPSASVGVATPPPGSTPSPDAYSPLSGNISGISTTLEPGSELGPRYRIESVLGRGGMGAVYKAYDKELDRTVALKLVRPELTMDAGSMQRFKQELLLASRISHKNVLRIHDLGDVGGVKFISMAYVEGQDLHQLLQVGRLRLKQALAIVRQLCAALEAAHAEGVVHRDLKPQNVLMDKEDNAYVSDFGLAKSLEPGSAMMTQTGELLGTPRYMSPEQVEGKPADRRSDLYALGLILYEMVTGDVPFKGDSTLQVMYQRIKEKPKSPKLLNPDLPDYLVRIIMRCLERDPEQRYQHANEILADLDAERGPSVSRSVQISFELPAHRGWLVAGAVVLLLVAFAFVIPTTRNFILPRSPGPSSAPAGIPALSQGKYLAVLPFRALGNPRSIGYIADGLNEALSAKLFQLKGLRIASPDAADRTDGHQPLEKIARQLGVNLVVQGTLQGIGGKIAIVVSLQDATSGRLLWSQQFSGAPDDLLTLEDQIYNQLAAALSLNPSDVELARAVMHPTENTEAYDLYLKGKDAMHGQHDLKKVETAIQFYQEALQKDPNFALAYAGIANASLVMYREKKESFWAEKALSGALQAQRLNEELPEVHVALGSVYEATGKGGEAIIELDRALQLAPNSDEVYRRLGRAYLARGRNDEAIQAFQRAIGINSFYWENYNALGAAYYKLGDYAKALEAWRHITQIEPDNSIGYENIGDVYFVQGRYNDCVGFFQKALELQPSYDSYSNLGTAYFYLKRYSDAVKMFEKAVEISPNQQVAVGNLADAYRWSGQPEKAKHTYDRAITLANKELQVNPRNAEAMEYLALYYAKKGESTDALEFIRRGRSIDGSNIEFIYTEGVVQAIAGHPEEALRALREAFRKGYPPDDAENDPELKDLRSHPEFQQLVKELRK